MYQINKEKNNILSLEQKSFSELGFRERDHLQEWIAKNPEVLGEELLIIQKEFDGFNDTNERLDLLAIDKNSNLVIIENKLDDSGRDLTWQALKYTSYCSTLSTTQIIRIYQAYLNKYFSNEDAKQSILDFLDLEDENDLLLNKNDQRIIFVANNYRKEVTSTVLWLINHDIQIQCFKATPYKLHDDLFLQVDQIIPVPEVEEFMIDAKEKKQEEKTKGAIASETDRNLVEFWKKLKIGLANNNLHQMDNVNPNAWFNIGFWKGKGKFAFVLGRHAPRVEIYFAHDENKLLFDSMYKYKEEIDINIGEGIYWERLDNKKASRIKYEMPLELSNQLGKLNNYDSWDKKIDWFVNYFDKFYNVIYPYWERVQKEL